MEHLDIKAIVYSVDIDVLMTVRYKENMLNTALDVFMKKVYKYWKVFSSLCMGEIFHFGGAPYSA